VRTGIVFLKTERLDEITAFYVDRVGCELWMDQGDCRILSHGPFLLGFCVREGADTGGILTFVYPERESVDRMYERLRDIAVEPPRDNPCYPIYNFFAHDPEERMIEFQVFTGEVDWGLWVVGGER